MATACYQTVCAWQFANGMKGELSLPVTSDPRLYQPDAWAEWKRCERELEAARQRIAELEQELEHGRPKHEFQPE